MLPLDDALDVEMAKVVEHTKRCRSACWNQTTNQRSCTPHDGLAEVFPVRSDGVDDDFSPLDGRM